MNHHFAVLFILINLELRAVESSRSYVLSTESDDFTPDIIWLFEPSSKQDSADNPSATLHNVTLTPGPPYPSGVSPGAASFAGTPDSYMTIPNFGGQFNASEHFSWSMVVKPSSISESGVILEYWDGVGGIRIWQQEKEMMVEAQSTDNNVYSLRKNMFDTSSDWVSLVLSFSNGMKLQRPPRLKIHHAPYLSDTYGSRSTVTPENITLRGGGDIRIGASVDPSLPAFRGEVTCLRFHSVYVAAVPEAVQYGLMCDPLGNLSDVLPSIAGQYWSDTDKQIPLTLTTAETTQPPTTENLQPATMSAQAATATIFTCGEECFQLTLHSASAKISTDAILTEIEVTSFFACVKECNSTSGCVVVAVETSIKQMKQVGKCQLGQAGFEPVMDARYNLYSLDTES